jgi:hypothetical protein
MTSDPHHIDELTKYGFELALKYVLLAQKYELDPAVMLQEELDSWHEHKTKTIKETT